MSTKKCILAIRADWHSSGDLTLTVELWGRRSSQKFPETTSLQLAAPGSFDSVVACAPTPLKVIEGKCIRFRRADSLAALGMKRGGDHRRNSLNQHRYNWLHRDLSTPSFACAPTPLKMTEGECIRFRKADSLAALGIKRGGDHRRNSLNQDRYNWLHRDLSTPSVACAPTPLKMTEGKCICCCTAEAMS
jgi:hypothetical protein